jgi:hydrogenase expression/formation protein HypC
MCVAYPGKIISIENHHARVDFTGSVVPVNISMVDVAPGDYVLVHAGMAIQKVETEEAKKWIALFRDLEEATAETEDDHHA